MPIMWFEIFALSIKMQFTMSKHAMKELRGTNAQKNTKNRSFSFKQYLPDRFFAVFRFSLLFSFTILPHNIVYVSNAIKMWEITTPTARKLQELCRKWNSSAKIERHKQYHYQKFKKQIPIVQNKNKTFTV